MRGRPSETVAGIRTLLKETVGPELASEQAAYALRRIMAVLRETDWDDQGFQLLAENAALRTLAADVQAVLGDRSVPVALERWATLAAAEDMPRSYVEAEKANAALRTAIAETVSALEQTAAAAEVRAVLLRGFLLLYRAG